MFADIKNDKSFQWQYLSSRQRRWIENINCNNFFASIFPDLMYLIRFLVNFKINRHCFLLQLFGVQISYGKHKAYPALIYWKIGV